MTTDDFTTAARAEGRVRADEWMDNNGGPQTTGHHIAHASIISGFRKGAEWARDRLAAQEPTDAEVEAAARALAYWDGASGWGTPAWDGEVTEIAYIYGARKALSAARKARS